MIQDTKRPLTGRPCCPQDTMEDIADTELYAHPEHLRFWCGGTVEQATTPKEKRRLRREGYKGITPSEAALIMTLQMVDRASEIAMEVDPSDVRPGWDLQLAAAKALARVVIERVERVEVEHGGNKLETKAENAAELVGAEGGAGE
jgi:hypothetical protein